jgi:hypothetical protein
MGASLGVMGSSTKSQSDPAKMAPDSDVSAGQNVGPLDREGRCLFQPPLPPDEATWALAAAAGISTVGLRPSFVIPAAAHSHPDCRAILILIVAPHSPVSHDYHWPKAVPDTSPLRQSTQRLEPNADPFSAAC